MNVCGVTFGGYLTKILSFKTGNLLNNSKFHLLSEGTVQREMLYQNFPWLFNHGYLEVTAVIVVVTTRY